MTYRVIIKSYETGEVIKTIGTGLTEKKADKVDSGVNRNLNHERFFTLVEEEE